MRDIRTSDDLARMHFGAVNVVAESPVPNLIQHISEELTLLTVWSDIHVDPRP